MVYMYVSLRSGIFASPAFSEINAGKGCHAAMPGASFRREATKGLPGGSFCRREAAPLFLVQEGKTLSGLKVCLLTW